MYKNNKITIKYKYGNNKKVQLYMYGISQTNIVIIINVATKCLIFHWQKVIKIKIKQIKYISQIYRMKIMI